MGDIDKGPASIQEAVLGIVWLERRESRDSRSLSRVKPPRRAGRPTRTRCESSTRPAHCSDRRRSRHIDGAERAERERVKFAVSVFVRLPGLRVCSAALGLEHHTHLKADWSSRSADAGQNQHHAETLEPRRARALAAPDARRWTMSTLRAPRRIGSGCSGAKRPLPTRQDGIRPRRGSAPIVRPVPRPLRAGQRLRRPTQRRQQHRLCAHSRSLRCPYPARWCLRWCS